MSRYVKFPLRGVMKASGAILRFLNKEYTQSNLQEWQQHQSTVLGVKYAKLINIIFAGEYEFDDEPEMDEELATEVASASPRISARAEDHHSRRQREAEYRYLLRPP
jgi:hypothetical protein